MAAVHTHLNSEQTDGTWRKILGHSLVPGLCDRTSVSSLPGFHPLLACLYLASSAPALLILCLQYHAGPSVLPYHLLTSLRFCLSCEDLSKGSASLVTRFLGTGRDVILDEKRFSESTESVHSCSHIQGLLLVQRCCLLSKGMLATRETHPLH